MKQQISYDPNPIRVNTSSPMAWVFLLLAAAALGWIFMKALTTSTMMAAAVAILVFAAFLWSCLAERHIPVLLIGLFALLPFQQSVLGENSPISVSATDCLALFLILALPVLALRQGRLRTGPVGLPMFVFFAVAMISSIVFWEGLDTANSLFRMFMVTLVAVLLFANAPLRLITIHRCFWAYLIAIDILSVLSVLAFLQNGIHGSEGTLGINKNALGPTFGCGVVIALVYLLTSATTKRQRIWLIASLGGATVGLMLCLSRGAWIATGAGFLLVLLMTRNFRAFVISLIVLTGLITAIWRFLPSDARDYASDVSAQSSNIHSRLVTIDDVMRAYHKNPLIGVGVGLRKQLEPHNVLVLTLGETGIIGVASFIGMFLGGFYTFVLALRTTRGDPVAFPIIVIGAALLLVSLTHGMMDVYWRRGVGFMGWSCVGIAANLIAQKRRQRLLTPSQEVADQATAA